MRTGFLAEAITGGQFDINPLNVQQAIFSLLTSLAQGASDYTVHIVHIFYVMLL